MGRVWTAEQRAVASARMTAWNKKHKPGCIVSSEHRKKLWVSMKALELLMLQFGTRG